MSGERQRQLLRGRDRECETLRDLISNVQSGSGQALVVTGEAGVGKTALLRYVVDHATAYSTIHVTGVESAMELAYAGLHQLCAPLTEHIDRLPAPQCEALNVAFGRGIGSTPDRFLVGLAVLSLMAFAADRQPLLCVIDDVQWLDEVSVQTLGFVARRLLAEPVAMVMTTRGGGSDVLADLPQMAVGGLADADARALLDSVIVGRLDERVRDRIVAEARGIPLALLEVPRNFSAAALAGGFAPATPTAVGQVEEAFVRRIQSLPAPTRRLVLLAAAEPVGDSALFLRAAARLGIPVDALGPAEAAGVIEFGPRMYFHHPLVRSAAYRAADLTDRRAIHRALADATDPDSDPDRRAWHAANAAAGPDDAVAAELETSADRAQSRGGVAAAAAFLERSAVLTKDPAQRAARALAAARAKRQSGAPAAAYELLAIAEMGPLSDLQRAQLARMRAQMEFVRSRAGEAGAPRSSEAAAKLGSAARQLEGLDDDLARETHLEAVAAAMYSGRLGDAGQLRLISEAGRAAVDRIDELVRPIDYLLSGITRRILEGPGAGSDDLRSALDLWNVHGQQGDSQPAYWPFPIAQESAAHELWDDAMLQHIATDMVRRARDAGALAVLPPALAFRAGVHVFLGEFATAARLIEEANTITASMGHSPVKYHSLTVAAWRGVPADALSVIESAVADGNARGEGRLIGLAGYTSAVLFNGVGRYEEALAAARECCEYEDLGFYSWCLFELIEAAAHVGDRPSADAALPKFEERALTSGTDWGLGAVASARALLATQDDAEAYFVDAIERLERAQIGLHVTRTRLSYGEWLRRANRRVDARQQLNIAYDRFTRMGAQGFAERARRELVATGEKMRRHSVSTGDQLTGQEAQIARLAANGLTNQEIGAQLFISTHTVEWHLRKVFVKLGISSRRQLRAISWAS